MENDGLTPRTDDNEDEDSAMEKAKHACCFSCVGCLAFWATLAALIYNEKRYATQEQQLGADVHSHWLRYAMFLANWLATAMFFYPLYAAVDVIGDMVDDFPSIGDQLEDLMENLAGAGLCLLSCAISSACCLIAFGLVWMYLHPTIGWVTLAVAALLIIAVIVYKCQTPASEKRLQRQQKKGMIAQDEDELESNSS
jgi:hypothetical protein